MNVRPTTGGLVSGPPRFFCFKCQDLTVGAKVKLAFRRLTLLVAVRSANVECVGAEQAVTMWAGEQAAAFLGR